MHFVHWNREKYANISEASDKEDGLAVVGLLASVVGLFSYHFKLENYEIPNSVLRYVHIVNDPNTPSS